MHFIASEVLEVLHENYSLTYYNIKPSQVETKNLHFRPWAMVRTQKSRTGYRQINKGQL